MPSNPSQFIDDDALQSIQHAPYTRAGQHTSAPHFNQHAAAHPSQTLLHASYTATSSQASSSCNTFHPQYPPGNVPLTPHPFNPQHNLHYTTLGYHDLHYPENAQNYQPSLHGSYTPVEHSDILYPKSHTRGHRVFPNAHPYTSSWPIPEQSSRSSQPDQEEALPARDPIFQQHEALSLPSAPDAYTPRPMLIQNRSYPSSAQPRFASGMPPQLPLAETPYSPRELSDTVVDHDRSRSSVGYAATETRKDDIPLPNTFNKPIAARSPVNWLPKNPVPKRKWGDGTSPSAKRLCNNQKELSICPPTNNESGRGHGPSTEEGYAQQLHELVPSRGSSPAHSCSTGSSALAKGVPTEPPNGFLSHSSNNVIHHPIMVDNSQRTVDNSQHHHIQGDQPDGTLLWLKEYIMEGAEFDSSERDPPPRCHPNTRASIIERMLDWIKDPRREKKMRWVRGTAGVGKSAIVQTVFESLPEDTRGGSVFFSRPNGRNNPNQVFPSFAYQLAVRDLSYRAYLKELMLKDPRSLCKSMKEQFRILFEVPFAKQKLLEGQDTLVMVLDGLDECGGDPANGATDTTRSRGRSSESAQREIVELISEFMQQYPSVPLIWIIASRPEKHLQVTFAGNKVEPTITEEEVPVDSVEACQDVERYLNSEFTRIRNDHDDLIPTTPWPSSKDFSLIATKASGLFIFAQVVIRFIDDSNPIEQLKYALAAISKASSSEVVENPLIFLDAMYMEIVSKVPPKLLGPATKIIGTIVLFEQQNIRKTLGTLPTICNILDISRDVALTALRHLHSVLFFPKVIASSRPSFYHASFRDFLEDESRSSQYSINEVKTGDDLAEGLMRFYAQELLDDSSLPWPRNRDSDRLVEMANNEDNIISLLLSFRVTLFSSKFCISETPIFPLRFIHDLVTGLRSIFRKEWFARQPVILKIISNLSGQGLQKHEQLRIVCRRPIDSLGITRDTVSKCLIIDRVDCLTVVLNEPRCLPENEHIMAFRELLCDYIELQPPLVVVVWGGEQFKRLALLSSLSHYRSIARYFNKPPPTAREILVTGF